MLTLTPTNLGHDLPDYYVLDENRKKIGRIYQAREISKGRPDWFWANWRTPNVPGQDRGYAWSLEDAKKAFKAAREREPG